MSYFVGILSGVGDIFLSDCSQIFFLLNIKFRGIFKPFLNHIKVQLYVYQSLKGTYIWVNMNIQKKKELRVVVFIF